MEGLGTLGFWLMLGMVLAAGTLSEALKARDKEREREATLRALLDKDSQSVTDILAYLRERDEAERKLQRALSGLEWHWSPAAAAVAKGLVAFVGVIATGFFVGLALAYGFFGFSESASIPLFTMLVIWATGPVIAWRVWRSARQKNDAPPAA
jgi:hypothetical protein